MIKKFNAKKIREKQYKLSKKWVESFHKHCLNRLVVNPDRANIFTAIGDTLLEYQYEKMGNDFKELMHLREERKELSEEIEDLKSKNKAYKAMLEKLSNRNLIERILNKDSVV